MPSKLYDIGIMGIWSIVFNVGFASTGCWSSTTNKDIKHVYLFSVMRIEKDGTPALGIYIGPLSLVIGVTTC